MQQPPRLYKIEISAKTIIFTIVVLLLLQLLWLVRELLFSFIIAFIVMSAFNPLVSRLGRWRIPRVLSTMIIFIVVLGGIGYLFAWILPPVVHETTILLRNLPDSFQGFNFNWDQNFFTKYVPDITGNAFSFLRNTFSNIIFAISTIFFSFYFLVEEEVVKKTMIRFFDKKDADAIADMFSRAEKRMREWVWGELILMLSIGITTYVGLTLLGIRYAVPLAVLAGLLEVVPIIGPIISAIPAFLITSTQSLFTGFTVVALYFVIQQLENQVLVPVIMNRAVGLNPIITLTALIIGGKLGGTLGIILAIPATLCIETVTAEIIRLRRSPTSQSE